MYLPYNNFPKIKVVAVYRYGFSGVADRVRAFPFGITYYDISS